MPYRLASRAHTPTHSAALLACLIQLCRPGCQRPLNAFLCWQHFVVLQATADLTAAQQQAAKEAAARSRLEADLAGCRSWIRELEKTEQQYLKSIRWVSTLSCCVHFLYTAGVLTCDYECWLGAGMATALLQLQCAWHRSQQAEPLHDKLKNGQP